MRDRIFLRVLKTKQTERLKMKNTINRAGALRELNNCFKNAQTYNEAITLYFENYICDWLKINPSLLPTEPQVKMYINDDGIERVIPLQNLISEAIYSINNKLNERKKNEK